MKRGRVNVLASAAAFALLAFGAAARHRGPMLLAASQCTADTDCKGDRICSAGRCIEPQALAPAPKANVPTPGPGAARMPKDQLRVCSDDRDCGGGLLCRRGDCISPPPPAAATPRPAPVPANFSTPAPAAAAAKALLSSPAEPLLPGRCVNDVDCSGDAVCTHGACTFPQSGPVAPAAGVPEKFKAPNILSVRRFGSRS